MAPVGGGETELVSSSLFGGLARLLRRLRARIWRALLFLVTLGRSPRPEPALEETVLSVRALYRSFLTWAEKHAFARERSQTPLEYLQALSLTLPAKGAELQVITAAYVKARYGRRPPGGEEFEAARQAWHKIKLAS